MGVPVALRYRRITAYVQQVCTSHKKEQLGRTSSFPIALGSCMGGPVPNGLQQPERAGAENRLHAVVDVELVVEMLEVHFDGIDANDQRQRDFLVCASIREQAQHLQLAFAEHEIGRGTLRPMCFHWWMEHC